MQRKFTAIPVRPETKKAVKKMAVEKEVHMYEVADKLLENREIILE